MIQPDIFIVGAPKAGTTSLFDYLDAHPLVLGTTPKETHFFADDLPGIQLRKFRNDFAAAFSREKPSAQHGMDGSTNYLHSQVAISNIRRDYPEARLIAMLRNPVDTAYAFHHTLLRNHDEDVISFERAWRLQAARRTGNQIPRRCREPKQLQYREIVMFAGQIERLMATFPPEQYRIILFDDFVADTARVYAAVLSFLDLPSDGRTTFDLGNPNVEIRARWLDAWIMRPPSPLYSIFQTAERVGVPPSIIGRANNKLRRLNQAHNQVVRKRAPLAPAFRRELGAEFADDIQRLAALIGRNLDHWLTV
ncbi:MAG: sulfotransferase [Chloroflexota bacterium]|nr:sulfotransferase [Chloroflexota bacterium]